MLCIVREYEDIANNQRCGITEDGFHVILEELSTEGMKHQFSSFGYTSSVSAVPFIAMGFLAGIT